MNELFAADPTCCASSVELRFLLDKFGPFAGRYLVSYPASWREQICNQLAELKPFESERVKTILRRARENSALLEKRSLPWDSSISWIENAVRLIEEATPPQFQGLIVPANSGVDSKSVTLFDDLDIPPTADEKVLGTSEEYIRVSKTLLHISSELYFIDPYLNPCKNSVAPILEKMLAAIGKKCERVVCFARESNVIGDRMHSWNEVRAKLTSILAGIEWPDSRIFEYYLVDDERSDAKMHGRYLLSIKGAIRFDQGFQRQPKGRKVDISPVGAKVHDELLRQYHEGEYKSLSKFSFP